LTADCLPLFLASRAGDRIGLFHVGWRGLVTGIVERAVEAMAVEPGSMLAWLGPAIGPRRFEVGPEVAELLVQHPGRDRAVAAFGDGRYLADLPALVRRRLERSGVSAVESAIGCTYDEAERWFSHRRRSPTGRMASLIWLRPADGSV
jgi:hypothetical protein